MWNCLQLTIVYIIQFPEFYRLEREKILKDFGTDVLVPMTPTKPGGLERLSSIVEVPLAEMSKVTHTKKLDILANIYSSCLKGLLCKCLYLRQGIDFILVKVLFVQTI